MVWVVLGGWAGAWWLVKVVESEHMPNTTDVGYSVIR
jgi:hypothetical protein